MGESRLERGLRVAAWTALAATLFALIGLGIFLQPRDEADDREHSKAAATVMEPAGAVEETE